jgi:hypothetical protein
MPRLILSMDGLVLKEMPLEKERTTIGRKPHNDIQIDNLAISGEHAAIVTILNDAFLEDHEQHQRYLREWPAGQEARICRTTTWSNWVSIGLKFHLRSSSAGGSEQDEAVAFAQTSATGQSIALPRPCRQAAGSACDSGRACCQRSLA